MSKGEGCSLREWQLNSAGVQSSFEESGNTEKNTNTGNKMARGGNNSRINGDEERLPTSDTPT